MGFFELFAGALAAFYALIPSFGLAIILLTLAVRALLLPLSIKQTKSMREMQVIQPEVKKLQAKHKNDRQKLNEEMMKLYKEHGVNPFGGCLPLLMQMPLFIGLYQVVRLNLRYMGYKVSDVAAGFVPIAGATGLLLTLQQSKLAQDLLHPVTRVEVNQFLPGLRLDCSFLQAWQGVGTETVDTSCGAGNPLLSSFPYLLLIGIMGFTTYYQQRQLMAGRGPQDQQAQQMQMIMRFMPLLLMAFAIGIPIGPGFPAGVVLYWVTTNIWTIVQQRLILARLGPAPALAAGKAAGKPKGASGKAGTNQSGKSDGKAKGSQTAKSPKAGGTKAQGGNGAKSTARSGSSKKKRRR